MQPTDNEAFEKLLNWLDPDRQKAGEKYRMLHLRLTRIFAAKGCCQAEDLADETFNVIARKIDWLIENYVGDPALYFFGVAKKIYKPPRPIPHAPPAPNNTEIEHRCSCLEECLNHVISAAERESVLRYHQKDKGEKIRERKELAKELGISLNALRIRIWHIHAKLRPCVQQCVERLHA
jgi:DNA-directed RNA polymerase specialized sigma24 family protein